MTTKSQILQLCEVEIYSRENLAFGKDTNQTSENHMHKGPGSLAVDGNSTTNYNKGSCTHTNVTDKAWWRVDLVHVEPVSEVYIVNRGDCCSHRLDNFEILVGSGSNNGGVANPKCGGRYSVPGGKGLSFFCRPPLYGRYVTIRSLKMNEVLTLCEVEVYSERRACHIQALGVSSKGAFPDNSFSALSNSGNNVASKGRLNGVGAWSPSSNNNFNDFLQINLHYVFFICAVATQGKSTEDHWTTKYKISLSLNSADWVTYKENGTDKVFDGNSGRNDIVKHNLKETARARFIQFQPITYSTHKALRVEVFGILTPAVPSQAPSNLSATAKTSTSIEASWQLPSEDFRNGNITGFKLFHKKKGSSESSTKLTINSGSTLKKVVIGLDKYTEYEFQVLAFTSVGDGPKSTVKVERTKEDAPDVPATLSYTNIAPDKSHGPKINLTWSEPIETNGIIRSYTLFYGYEKGPRRKIARNNTLSYSVDVLGGLTYQFYVTVKPGENASLTIDVLEYEPSIGPDNVLFSKLNKSTFNISWAPLTRKKSYGEVILYDVKQEMLSRKKSPKTYHSNRTVNTTATFVILYDLPLCSQYHVSVRAYTKAGPGPYSHPLVLEASRPEPPSELKEKSSGTTEVTLEWKEPSFAIKGATSYTVNYSGTKSYNDSFKDDGFKDAIKSTTYSINNLVPGTQYDFKVYANIEVFETYFCNKSSVASVKGETRLEAPIAPVVPNVSDVTITEPFAVIHLWPVEQRNGPVSAYQVIVLKVVDGAKDLPDNFDSKLKDAINANKENLNFYIAGEMPNVPVFEESWNFTIGDDIMHGGFINQALKTGEEYVIFQRAVTRVKDLILKGEVGKVARIVVAQDIGGQEKRVAVSDSSSPVYFAVPVVLLMCIVGALVAIVWLKRKLQGL